MTTPTTTELQTMLNVSECGHPGPWAKNQTGAVVDAQGCEVITAWDGTASINLAAAAPGLAAEVIRLRDGIEKLVASMRRIVLYSCGDNPDYDHGYSDAVDAIDIMVRALLDGGQS